MSNTVSNRFRLDANRARLEARNATKHFMVVALKKDGTRSKRPYTETDWAYCAAVTRAEAEVILAAQQAMNPTLRFEIVAL